MARHDPLSGLSNRRDLRDRLEGLLSRQTADQGPAVNVMYVDLDGFKRVNDTLAHHAGDEVLATVAERLTTVLRHDDIVARLGGDEFLVVAVNATLPRAPRWPSVSSNSYPSPICCRRASPRPLAQVSVSPSQTAMIPSNC
ncbi:GGDEF domain-containing protein [Paraburkholderia hospita]|uniref:GGDEF domain-containing protein n=1 Tax=Paraburkholderia hospita TaxID=169430 RepID=UPI001FCA3B83|nr:GGDEF domain-containing protein [Paraburkholderia hospita]